MNHDHFTSVYCYNINNISRNQALVGFPVCSANQEGSSSEMSVDASKTEIYRLQNGRPIVHTMDSMDFGSK